MIPQTPSKLEFASNLCKNAGALLLKYFGNASGVMHKGDISNVVTEADIACDKYIVAEIKTKYPNDSILSEEGGYCKGKSEYTWVVDPIDGTSNFAAGIPWFGVLLALFKDSTPILGVLHLPVSGELYCAEVGKGAYFENKRLKVTSEEHLRNVLWSYGMDANKDKEQGLREVQYLSLLKNSVRNLRATNSLVDACFTADGRLGGFANQQMKIWDIAASHVIIAEAGGKVSDLNGSPLQYDLQDCEKNYIVIACAKQLHDQALALSKIQ